MKYSWPEIRMPRHARISRLVLMTAIVFSAGTTVSVHGQSAIIVTGFWSLALDNTDLQAGAGSDFVNTYESAVDQVSLEISGKKVKGWQVDVRMTAGSSWHSSLALAVRRTSAGQGGGSVSGGTSYQTITTTDRNFLSGDKKLSGIDLQYRLSGMSVTIPAGTYTTTVTYTVTDI